MLILHSKPNLNQELNLKRINKIYSVYKVPSGCLYILACSKIRTKINDFFLLSLVQDCIATLSPGTHTSHSSCAKYVFLILSTFGNTLCCLFLTTRTFIVFSMAVPMTFPISFCMGRNGLCSLTHSKRLKIKCSC